MYRSDISYINNETADAIKNSAAATNVNLKTNFSTPRLVKDEEFELLEKPVPLTCRRTKIIKNKALTD
jgi:hypothetical protein